MNNNNNMSKHYLNIPYRSYQKQYYDKPKQVYRPVQKKDSLLNIPEAPELKALMDEKQFEFIQGTKKSELICRKLSKKACSDNSDCTYSDDYSLCMPKYTLVEKPDQKQSYESFYFESRRLWREGVTEWLKADVCNLPAVIKDIQVFTGKESASDSIILFGKIQPGSDLLHSTNRNIVIKLTFEHLNPLENLLEVERAIYRNIITNLINNKHTPNLMAYLGDSTCTAEKFAMSRDQAIIFKNLYDDIDGDEYNKNIYHLLVMEKSLNSTTMGKWFKENHSEKEILAVIFQVLYTLVCFANIGLSHNDLHPGNIFIEDFGKEITLYFQRSDNKYIKLVTRYIPKIYDFDRGSIVHPAVPINLGLDKDYCKEYGTCNYANEKFDMYQFISTLHMFLLRRDKEKTTKEELDNMENIRNNIKTKWITKILNWKWYSEILNRDTFHRLAYNDYPTDTEFNQPKTILSKFIDAEWNNDVKPWVEITANKSDLPSELVFTPPNPTKLVTELWKPESTETHMSFSGEIPNIINPEKFFTNETKILMQIWVKILEKNSYNYNDKIIKLYMELVKLKPDIGTDVNKKTLYSYACYCLIFPMFYRISKQCQDAIAYSEEYHESLTPFIDDIWNVFGNKLPVEIVRFTRNPITKNSV